MKSVIKHNVESIGIDRKILPEPASFRLMSSLMVNSAVE